MKIRALEPPPRIEIESPLSRSLAGDEPIRGGLSARGGRPPATEEPAMWDDPSAGRLLSSMLVSMGQTNLNVANVWRDRGYTFTRGAFRLGLPRQLRDDVYRKWAAFIRWTRALPTNQGYVSTANYDLWAVTLQAWFDYTMDLLFAGPRR